MRLTISMDTSGLVAALAALGPKADLLVKSAAKRTAERVKSEVQRRVRQATGQTRAGIAISEDYSKTGFVVATTDARRRSRKKLHVGTFLEYGTEKMTAKPFFYTAAKLEESAHLRRIADAVSDAIAASGLGK